jgi:hypothetical protein
VFIALFGAYLLWFRQAVFLGQVIFTNLVQRNNKTSLVIYIVGGVVIIGAIALTVVGKPLLCTAHGQMEIYVS